MSFSTAAFFLAVVFVVMTTRSRGRRRRAAAQREDDKATRSRVKKIESRVAHIDQELGKLETRLADPATYNGPTAELMTLSQQQAELRREKETLEAEWLELHEQLDA